MIVRDDYSHYTWVFFLRHKNETAKFFSEFLARVAPRKVGVVRTDGGEEFSEGKIAVTLPRAEHSREFTTADSLEYNGVSERQNAINESAGLAAKLQDPLLFRTRVSRVATRCGSRKRTGHVMR